MPTTSGSYLELWSHTTPNASARMTNPYTDMTKRRRKPLSLPLSPTGRGEGEGLLTVCEVACISSIGVQPREEEVDAPEAEDDHAEAEDLVERGAMTFPAPVHAGMDVGAVNQPHDQRPGLLGVPGPVPAPCVVGPHGAQNDPEGQQRESDHDRLVAELVDLLQARKRLVDRAPAPPALRALLEQVHHAQATRHRERRVAGQRDGDVDVDPIAVPRRPQ